MNNLLEFCWFFDRNHWEKCEIIKYEEDNIYIRILSSGKIGLFNLSNIKIANNNSIEEFQNEPAYQFAQFFNSHEVSRNPVGSGPYIFKEWRTDDRVVLEKSANYWKSSETESLNLVDKLVFKTVKQHDAALTGLKAQEIDLIRSLPAELFFNQTNSSKFKKNNDKESFYYPNYSYIGWNNEHPIFSDKRVRRAMTHLCNRAKIADILYYGEAQSAIGNVYFKRPEYHQGIGQSAHHYLPDQKARHPVSCRLLVRPHLG